MGEALAAAPQAADGAAALGALAPALADGALVQHKDKVSVRVVRSAAPALGAVRGGTGRGRRPRAIALHSPDPRPSAPQDVRLATSLCLAHALRVAAPDTPYSPAQLADVFGLFAESFAVLADRSAPGAASALAVLDTVASVKCCVLSLDLDSADAAAALADGAFAAAGGAPPGALADPVADPALDVLTCMLDDADDVPEPLVVALLSRLLPPARDAAPGAAALARATLRRCEARLQPALQRVLVGAIDAAAAAAGGGPADGRAGGASVSALAPRATELIAEVHAACPQALLPVLPHLAAELTADGAGGEARRAAAAGLLAALLADPGAGLAGGPGAPLLADLLGRARDKAPALRLQTLARVPDLLAASVDAPARSAVLSAAVGRLTDPDDRVRAAAVRAVAGGAAKGLHLVTSSALDAVAARLRDSKPAVAREAAASLLALFRAHAARKHAGMDVSAGEGLVLWIPARLVSALAASADLRHHAADVLFRQGAGTAPALLPASLSPAAAARQWTAIWMEAAPGERRALAALLRARGATAAAARAAVAARSARAAKDEGAAPRLARALAALASAFPDPARDRAGLAALFDARDNGVARAIADLAAPGARAADAAAAAAALLARAPAGAAKDAARGLAARLAPALIPPDAIPDLLMEAASSSTDGRAAGATRALLAAAADADPSLCARSAPACAAALASDDPTARSAALAVLAAAGAAMRAEAVSAGDGGGDEGDTLGSLTDALRAVAWDGPADDSKLAVSALSALLPADAAASTLAALAARAARALAGARALAEPRRVRVSLAVLAAVGGAAPAALAPHVAGMASFVTGTLLRAPASAFGRAGAAAATATGSGLAAASPAACLRGDGLEDLAAALAPTAPSAAQSPAAAAAADALIPDLALLLDPDPIAAAGVPPADAARVRLAAARGLLTFLRARDVRVPPGAYIALALAVQDPELDVRARVRDALVSSLDEVAAAHGGRAARLAAPLALAAVDPSKAGRAQAYDALLKYAHVRRAAAAAAAKRREARAGGGGGATAGANGEALVAADGPEAALPYLLQVLAHHPDLPAVGPGCAPPTAADLAPFAAMLQLGVQPLLDAAPPRGTTRGACLHAACKVLRAVRAASDATAEPADAALSLLADAGIALAREAAARAGVPKAAAAAAPAADRVPGGVPLPKSLFRPASPPKPRAHDGDALPTGWVVPWVDLVPGRAPVVVAAGGAVPARKRKPRPPGPRAASKANAAPQKAPKLAAKEAATTAARASSWSSGDGSESEGGGGAGAGPGPRPADAKRQPTRGGRPASANENLAPLFKKKAKQGGAAAKPPLAAKKAAAAKPKPKAKAKA